MTLNISFFVFFLCFSPECCAPQPESAQVFCSCWEREGSCVDCGWSWIPKEETTKDDRVRAHTHTQYHTHSTFFFSCFTVQVDVSVSLWVLALWLLKWTLYYNQEANSAIRLKRKKRRKKKKQLTACCVCAELYVCVFFLVCRHH